MKSIFNIIKQFFFHQPILSKIVILVFILIFIPLVLALVFLFFLISLLTGSVKLKTFTHPPIGRTNDNVNKIDGEDIEDVEYEELK